MNQLRSRHDAVALQTWIRQRKRQNNLIKHGLDFADTEKVFNSPLVLIKDPRADYGE